MLCSVCEEQIDAKSEHLHRACGHHMCMLCLVPMLRAGKTLCARCPQQGGASLLGNLVLGTDHEQVLRAETALATERRQQVGSLSPLPEAAAASGDGRPAWPINMQLTTATAGQVKRCRAAQPADNCDGKPFCVHFCYDALSADAMRAAVDFDGDSWQPPREWTSIVHRAVQRALHPQELVRYGFTAELFAYCGVTLHSLLVRPPPGMGVVESCDPHRRRYLLEHLLDAFHWQLADLRLLDFSFANLVDPAHYPLVVLYQRANFDAEQLFSFDISYNDLHQCLLQHDERYAQLLNLNLRFWQKALTV